MKQEKCCEKCGTGSPEIKYSCDNSLCPCHSSPKEELNSYHKKFTRSEWVRYELALREKIIKEERDLLIGEIYKTLLDEIDNCKKANECEVIERLSSKIKSLS